ncbi:MAG: hypothetical protein MUP85_04210 [Candidatus Lokiarchaeota archaeon]|nr:hypothetical protein [Candidatus Lokiarchaeota archaeon]
MEVEIAILIEEMISEEPFDYAALLDHSRFLSPGELSLSRDNNIAW